LVYLFQLNFKDQGECNLIIDEKVAKTLRPGDCFGEKALLYNDVRSGSI
jgi:CRP-like cAMP-binding protein